MESLLQTEKWAKFKERFGWNSMNFDGLHGLSRFLPFGKSLLYFPEIPLNSKTSYLLKQIREQPDVSRIFTRLEFLEPYSNEAAGHLVELGLIKAFEDVQPEYRQWINLEESIEKILEQMKPKGRYNIRLAQKHDLKVTKGITDDSINITFNLYQMTSLRTGFKGRDLPYFQALAKLLKDNEWGEIIIVFHKGEPLAAVMLSFYGGIASYLYGGSSNVNRELMAPYLAHFEAIKEAKKRECQIYDLLAVAPTDKPDHIHSGLTRFKTQFGGETVRLLGSWDLVHSQFWYTLYKLAERRRRRAI